MDIETSIIRFLEDLSIKRAVKTVISYENALKVFRHYLQVKNIPLTAEVEIITLELLIRYPAFLGRQAYSKGTNITYLAGLRAYMEYLIIEGVLTPTYQDSLRLQKSFQDLRRRREQKLPRFPKEGDAEQLCKIVQTMNYKSPTKERNIAILEWLYSTGCRIDELSTLTIAKIDLNERTAVVMGKGQKERVVFLSTNAANALKEYWRVWKHNEPSAPIFARHDKKAGKNILPVGTHTIWDVVKNVMNVAGIKKFSPHYFRHAFAIRMLQETNNLAMVQDLLGHANANSTRVYAKIYPRVLQQAHRKIYG